MTALATARTVFSGALDAYLLREAERKAAARSPRQDDTIARHYEAARRRCAAADALAEPTDDVAALLLYREAIIHLVTAMSAAVKPEGDLPHTAGEAWRALEQLEPGHTDLKPAAFDALRWALEDADPLALDRLAEERLGALRATARRTTTWLRANIDPRGAQAIRTARWVRIGLGIAVVCGVIAFGLKAAFGVTNVALGKPTTASSRLPGTGPASGATNGEIESNYGVQTTLEDDCWVMVDLQKSYKIHEVRVYNRGDGWQTEGLPILLQISSDKIHWQDISRRDTMYSQTDPWITKPPGMKARYVRLKRPARGYICISELEVYGS
jgi:hypothetical protein